MARIKEGKILREITVSACTGCGDQARYELSLDLISAASGANLTSLKSGDPWGNKYFIDENEGEGSDPCSNKDSLRLRPARSGVNDIRLEFHSCPS